MTSRLPPVPFPYRSLSLIKQGSPWNPDLFRVDFDDGRPSAVLKTFALKHPLVRQTVGRMLTRRESRRLRELDGVNGVCRIVGPGDPLGMILEYLEGRPLNAYERDELPIAVYEGLTRTVRRMHEAGVVHLDLSHRGNIFVREGRQGVLLDFQSALNVHRWPRWLRRRLERIDELALLKWKLKRFPASLEAGEQERVARRKAVSNRWPFHHWFAWPGTRRHRHMKAKRHGDRRT